MRRFVVLIGLLSACEHGDVRAPIPTAIEPAVVDRGEVVAVIVRGRDFTVDPTVSFVEGGIDVDSGFSALLGDTALLDVTYVDSETLTATVPSTLAAGVYALTVVDPRGREGALGAAFTVNESTVVLCETNEQCDDGNVCTGVETVPMVAALWA